MMEKLNVLEQLKTLKQWQLEQQLDFKNMNAEYGSSFLNSHNEIEQAITNDENKENEGIAVLENKMEHDVSPYMFMDRIPPNVLAQALRQVNLNSEDDSPIDLTSNTTKRNNCDVNTDNINNGKLNNQLSSLIEDNINSSLDGSYPGTDHFQTLDNQQTTNLVNWHMSGMQTVIFQDNLFHQGSAEDEITPIKFPLNSTHELSNYECSESEDGFSECDVQDDMDGCKPLSETEEEDYPNEFENKDENDVFVSSEMFDPPGVDEIDYFIEEQENTVIEMNISQKENEIVEERPITPGIKGNSSFHELIENEIQKEDQGYQQKSVVSSTPVKTKSCKFLKRGEGLKRFEYGNYSRCRKKGTKKGKSDEVNVQSKSSEVKSSSSRRNFKGSKETKKTNKGIHNQETSGTTGILKNNSNNSSKHVIVQSNERYVGKNTLHVINEDSSGAHCKGVREKNDDIPIKMIAPEENRKVTFEKSIKKDIMDSYTVASSSDVSFQNMLFHYKEKEERENNELDAFEALEEAAENTSLSSNCSLVIKHFGERTKSAMYECQSKNEMPLISEDVVASYDFDDEASWSDTSILSTDENDDTVIIREPSPDELLSPLKRIVSKRKQDENKVIDTSNSNSIVGHSVAQSVKAENEGIENNQDKASLSSLYSSNNISDTVKKKLSELEKEISKFRSENNKLSELRAQRENDVKQLRKEIETFQKEKAEELERIEEYRSEEMKKIKVERKLFDKYQKEIKAAPNKEEREEIKVARAEICNLKDESKTKELKWNSASHRFRTRIIELEEENGELREEIRLLEKQRLERWKSSEKMETGIKNKSNTENTNHVSGNKTDSFSINPSIAPVLPKISLDKQYGLGKENDYMRKDNKISEHPEEQYHLPRNIGENTNLQGKKEIKHTDGKVEVILPDLSRIITFPNGTKKTISKDEKTVTVAFFNGDIRKILPDNKLVYYYAESQTTHTTFPDGLEMLEFPNKQVEKRYPDGKTEVIFPDQTVKYIFADGSEETKFTDGTLQKVDIQGVRTINFANGQKEIHTKEYKRREYPNGTVKTVYEDGRQETKYSTGQVRVKDCHGNLLVDSGPK